jgi:hypothetical protein
MTPAQAKRLRNLITRRVNAAVDASWKGSAPPEDRAQLEEDLARAEQNLEKFIDELKGPRPVTPAKVKS